MTNISRLNFNLLKTLYALLSEQSVSAAAERLYISQPAVSLALKQLRELYGDELLVRGQSGKLTLTSLAESLLPDLKTTMAQIHKTLQPAKDFDPSSSTREFHLGLADHLALRILPKLLTYIAKTTPNIQIIQHALNHLDNTELLQKELDLAIGAFNKLPKSLPQRLLLEDKAVLVMSTQHPLAKRRQISWQALEEYPHIFVALEEHANKNFIYDDMIAKKIKVRKRLMTPHTLIPMFCLQDNLSITHSLYGLVSPFIKSHNLICKQPPYTLTPYQAKMYWAPKYENDLGHQWLRQTISSLF